MNQVITKKNAILAGKSAPEDINFERLLWQVPAYIWVRRPDFKISYMNFDEKLLDDEDIRLDQEVLNSKQESEQIKKYVTSDKVIHWFQVKRVLLGANTRSPSVMGFATEITEFYRSIEGCEKLLAAVSHDLKNPIAAVLLSATASHKLLSEFSSESSSGFSAEQLKVQVLKCCSFLKSIEKSCQTVMKLITNVLDSTKSTSGEVPLHLEKNNIYEVLEETLSFLGPLARQKSQSLCLEGEHEKIELVCDRVRMLQVFSNLIGNAIKFTQEGGEVIIKIKRLNSEFLFEVKDNGKGITPEQLPYVFNHYWQGINMTCAGVWGGMGLGLSIAKKNIEAHQGKIWIESIVGSGSQVFFTVPVSMALQ